MLRCEKIKLKLNKLFSYTAPHCAVLCHLQFFNANEYANEPETTFEIMFQCFIYVLSDL